MQALPKLQSLEQRGTSMKVSSVARPRPSDHGHLLPSPKGRFPASWTEQPAAPNWSRVFRSTLFRSEREQA